MPPTYQVTGYVLDEAHPEILLNRYSTVSINGTLTWETGYTQRTAIVRFESANPDIILTIPVGRSDYMNSYDYLIGLKEGETDTKAWRGDPEEPEQTYYWDTTVRIKVKKESRKCDEFYLRKLVEDSGKEIRDLDVAVDAKYPLYPEVCIKYKTGVKDGKDVFKTYNIYEPLCKWEIQLFDKDDEGNLVAIDGGEEYATVSEDGEIKGLKPTDFGKDSKKELYALVSYTDPLADGTELELTAKSPLTITPKK